MDCCLLFCPSPAFIYILQQLDLPSVFTVANITTNPNVCEMYNNRNTCLAMITRLETGPNMLFPGDRLSFCIIDCKKKQAIIIIVMILQEQNAWQTQKPTEDTGGKLTFYSYVVIYFNSFNASSITSWGCLTLPGLSVSRPTPTYLLLPICPPSFGLFRHFFLFKNNNYKKKKKKESKNTCTFQMSCVEPAAGLSGSQQQNCANPPGTFLLPPEGPFRWVLYLFIWA